MTARELISDLVPPLKTSDSGEKAMAYMNEFHLEHLPIVNNEQFLGLISEEDILDLNDPTQALGNHKLSLVRPVIYEHQHIYDVIKMASALNLSLIPVLDANEKYLGSITQENIIEFFAELSAVREPGGVLKLFVNVNDYSLSEISRIVESNGAMILSVNTASQKDSTGIEITLKVNLTDLKHIVATFERFEYNVSAYYQESDYIDDLKDNYESFLRYLDV